MADFSSDVLLSDLIDEPADALFSEICSEFIETLSNAGQLNVLIRFFRLCTDTFQCVVGQRDVSQANHVQIPGDATPRLHLVRAQLQGTLQLFKQHFDPPS